MSIDKIFNLLNEDGEALRVKNQWELVGSLSDGDVYKEPNKSHYKVLDETTMTIVRSFDSDDEYLQALESESSENNDEVSEEMLCEEIIFKSDSPKEIETFGSLKDLISFNSKLQANIIKNKPKDALKIHWMVDTDGSLTGKYFLEGSKEDKKDQLDKLNRCLSDLSDAIGYNIRITRNNSDEVNWEVLSGKVNEELDEDDISNSENLPKEGHVYWDKKHENAFYVVAVYPQDNKVSFWDQEGDRHQTTIDNFNVRFELSTNEDDYDIFEESMDKEDIANSLRDYLIDNIKSDIYHWSDTGEEADETDLIEYNIDSLKLHSDDVEESDELYSKVEDLVDKWKYDGRYIAYLNPETNVIEFD